MQAKYMRYIRYSFSMLMLFVLGAGMLFTSCEDDDDEENGSKIELLSYGPMPIARGGELRFIGSNLDKVTSIVIPDGIEIEAGDFTNRTTEMISLTVPQTAEEGSVVLKTPQGDITTKTPIGYSEPISIAEFSPAAVKPGDVLTIKGDYLNLVKEVIFTDRVVAVDSLSFESQSRKELQVVVPDAAETGIIAVSNGAEDPIIVYTEEVLNVTLPVISGLSPAVVKAGETLTISGSNLGIVRNISYAGETATDSIVSVSETGDEMVVYVPEDAQDGPVTVMPGSGIEVVSEGEIEMMTPTITAFSENPVKPGSLLRVTGTDLDLVTEIRFGAVSQTEIVVVSETEIEFMVPVEAPGGTVGFVTAAGKEVTSTEELQMIQPSISEIAPDAAPAGDVIRLAGDNLDLVATVTFTGGENVEATYDETKDSVFVTVPNGAVTGPLTIVAKNGEEVVTTMDFTFISINVPVVNSVPAAVMPGSLLVIEGEKLDLLTDVIFPGNVTATMFGTKTATLLEVYVPEGVTMGPGQLTFVTVDGETTVSPEISFGRDPITEATEMIMDFDVRESSDWHGLDWDNWGGSYDASVSKPLGYPVLLSNPGWWVVGCNHPDPDGGWPGVNPSNYVLKIDVRTETPITVKDGYEMAAYIGGNAVVIPLPEKDGYIDTNGAWMTVTMEISGLSNPTPTSGDFGIICNNPADMDWAGLSFDNLRYDPK